MNFSHTLTTEQVIALANQLNENKQPEQALGILVEQLKKDPAHVNLVLQASRLLHQHKHNKDALIILSKAYALGVRDLDLLYLFGALLHVERYFEDAQKIIREYLNKQPNSAPAWNVLGANYIEQNQYEEALSAYCESLKHNPHSADAHNNIAWAYRALGKKEQALSHFKQAFEVDPSATEALSGFLMLKTFTEKDAAFIAAEKCLKDSLLTPKKHTELAFALGKAYEDIKEFTQAFKQFKTANNSWRKHLDYHISSDQKLFKRLKSWPDEQTLSTPLRSSERFERQPIFVLGMPRSSTTLIEQILSAHSEVIGGGELPFLENLLIDRHKHLLLSDKSPNSQLEHVATRYLEQVNQHTQHESKQSARYVTDKLPLNFRFIGIILKLFPNAKIIHCQRDPIDTCFSLYKHHFPMANHHYAYDLKELAQYYNLYEDLMTHWHQLAPDKILDVPYEGLLENFEHHVKRMVEFCNLDFEEACLNYHENQRVVRTASSEQVRKGLYKTGSGHWKHYEKELVELKINLQSYS